MITLSDYIEDLDEVRAVLGVTDLELPDEVLELSTYARALQIALYSTTGTFSGATGSLMGIFDALNAEASPTEAEEVMLATIKEYALYVVAEAILPVLGMIATKRLSDGKAAVERFVGKDLDKQTVSEQIRARLSALASQLGALMGTPAASPTYLVKVEPDDVVTTV